MSPTQQALLDEFARRRGLGEAYYDHRGELRHFTAAARRAILQAMGLPVEDEVALQTLLASELQRTRSGLGPNDSPGICYQPAVLAARKCWGLGIQLYTLRSARNWGMGDFRDLCELIEAAAPRGCEVVGLNPLHALFLADPALCSPYSPSSRQFLNVLYICVETVPEFQSCSTVQTLCSDPSFQAALAVLRATDSVLYPQVATLKLSALRLLCEDFLQTQLHAGSARGEAFLEFVAAGGEALRLHAIFDALDTHFRERDLQGWRRWPVEYHNPHSQAVQEFADTHSGEIEFYKYAQWLADEQLALAQEFAHTMGMRIGLYGDLAVGASPDGSEVWSNQSLYVDGIAIGAPPDPLALNGQDWGIPPVDPHALQAQNYRLFAEILRANMRHVGALRIDHVMSLFRLWWVPRGFSAVEGVYVHYALGDVLTVLVRESQSARCLVIGEDLGTVPDEIRNAMERQQLYHYKVLLFEKDGHRFKSSGEYPHHAIAAATTHDLPPLRAWWQGDDLELRDRLGLYPNSETASRLREERTADRYALLSALNESGLWGWVSDQSFPEFSPALARAIHLYLAKTEAALVLVQPEDLIGMTDPVNVPGTHAEHANWQRKLSATTQDLFSNEGVRETLTAINKARYGQNPNA